MDRCSTRVLQVTLKKKKKLVKPVCHFISRDMCLFTYRDMGYWYHPHTNLKMFFFLFLFFFFFFFRFFSLLFVYLVVGMIFMKFVKKAEGKEVIPNSTFWFAIPGQIKVSWSTYRTTIKTVVFSKQCKTLHRFRDVSFNKFIV